MRDYTVVIPAFHSASFIAEGIASVRSQTVPPREIIVVDDGSTDQTADVVRELGAGIRLLQQKNSGPGSATTAGFTKATTTFVAGLDSDDLWLPQKMEIQFDALEAMPRMGICFTQTRQFRDGFADDGRGHVADGLTRTTLLMRTEAALENGPVTDATHFVGEMVDWIARLRERGGKMHVVPQVLALRRMRAGSLTSTLNRDRSGYIHAARQAIVRRREKTGVSQG